MLTSLLFAALFTPMLKVLRADGALSGYFSQYYRYMLFAWPLMILSTILGMFIRVDGRPQFCMLVSVIACVLNIVFDGIFMAKLGMGVRGSAVATLITQAVTAVMQLLHTFEDGRYGVYHFRGYPRYLFTVYQEVFCRWLAKSGNRLEKNKPIFDIYRKVDPDGYMEMDICFPLCEPHS